MDHSNSGMPSNDFFEMKFNVVTGVITILVRGFWTPSVAESYFIALEPLLIKSRRVAGHARLLVDRRAAPTQSAEVAERHQTLGLALARVGDQLALIAPSALAKLQLERLVPPHGAKVFLDASAAEAWLSKDIDK